jgi:hypothetical protein
MVGEAECAGVIVEERDREAVAGNGAAQLLPHLPQDSIEGDRPGERDSGVDQCLAGPVAGRDVHGREHEAGDVMAVADGRDLHEKDALLVG